LVFFLLKNNFRHLQFPVLSAFICVPLLHMPTTRKEIADLLEKESLDLRGISQILRIREKEVLDHLQHIARSVHPRKLTLDPAVCQR